MCARYYPRGDNRPSDWQQSGAFKFSGIYDSGIARWLYADDWSEKKYNTFLVYYNIPGMHEYLDLLLDHRSTEEYLDRYDMDYSDIHDPRKLKSTRSAGRMITWVSDNIAKLYV